MNLHDLQTAVHVAKDKRNDFGGYNYRTAEGILAAIKAELGDGDSILVTDRLQEVAGQIFVSATATVTFFDGTSHSAEGHALHPLTKKGMDPSQITGSASSYARKYALSGLVALDDGSADPDGKDNREAGKPADKPIDMPPGMPEPDPVEVKRAHIMNNVRKAPPEVRAKLEQHDQFIRDLKELRDMNPAAADEVLAEVRRAAA